MNIWFDKPNAAFHAYERSLLRPIAHPAPRDTPSLWQRAKEMFGVVMDSARTVVHLAIRFRLSRTERRDILSRLKPVEKLTRELLVTEAATLLLMTPEGMKLRREARIMAMPTRPQFKPLNKTAAPVTGSRLLAVLDPKTLAILRPGEPHARKPDTHDPQDPKTWRCAFNVMHWIHPEDDDAPPPKKSGPRPRLLSFDDIVAFEPKRSRRQSPGRDDGAGAIISRRIEALSRVLAKPDRAIRRLARFFASLPREALDPPDIIWIDMRNWHHGHNEARAARELSMRTLALFMQLRTTDFDGPAPEPG